MVPIRRRALEAAARALRMRVEQVDEGCYVVQEQPARHEVAPIGRPRLGVRLLVDRRRARRHVDLVQRRLSEHLLEEHVAWVLRATEVDCVLDVGANVGQFGTALRRCGYTGRIVSFEPVAALFARLSGRAADDPAWEVHRLALGREDGSAEIHSDPRTLSSLLPASDFGRDWNDRLAHGGTEPVTVRRLDGLFDDVAAGLRDVRAYLKLDTQGFDLEAFAGAAGCLDRVVAMQSELACVPLYDGMPRLAEQLAAYEGAGFEATGMFQVSRDLPTLRVIEFDCVLVRPGEVRRSTP